MNSVGLIDQERLKLIPVNYRLKHEFCFYLHDQLLNIFLQYEYSEVHKFAISAFKEVIKGRESEFEGLDFLKLLKERGINVAYRHHIISNVVLALSADMLNFLYEALRAFEKRKFTVGFSLLRKPLKENLLYLSLLLADEDDFIRRFEKKNYKSLVSFSKEDRLEILSRSMSKLPVKEMFDSKLVYDIIYSKNIAYGFEPTWQRATHLITSMGYLLKTDDYSFNFIFEDPADNCYYEFLYSKLPYILIYMTQVTLEVVSKVKAINHKTYNYLVLTTLGCYESIFSDGKTQHMARVLNSGLGELLKCLHCNAKFKITKKTAPSLYLMEEMVCKKCGLRSEVPLYWLLAQLDVSIAPSHE